MTLIAAVLSVLLATQTAGPAETVRAFVENMKASRVDAAYAQMSVGARKAFVRAQLDAYLASRYRALGRVTGVTNIRLNDAVVEEHNMTIYEADVLFENGRTPALFVLTREDGQWRILRVDLEMPAGSAWMEMSEALPVARELMEIVKSDGLATMAGRFSEADLSEAEQTPEMARAQFEMLAELLGPLERYTLNEPSKSEEACAQFTGEGTFRYGTAPLELLLCWSDGVWRMRHAGLKPRMNPKMLERSLMYSLKGEVTAKCPHDAPFPVGGTIVCRVTPKGEAPQDVTILRTTESGWKIVGLEPAK